MSPIGKWTAIVGGIGFSLGFFGPMILNPTSGNGPLLGIFITGPAGAVVGALIGLWRSRALDGKRDEGP